MFKGTNFSIRNIICVPEVLRNLCRAFIFLLHRAVMSMNVRFHKQYILFLRCTQVKNPPTG